MTLLLGLFHGADFIALHLALGSFVFLLFIVGLERASPKDWSMVRCYFGMTLVTSALWMIFVAQDMAESWDLRQLSSALQATHFGHLWCARIFILSLVFLGLRIPPNSRTKYIALFLIAIGAPLISALTGHAAVQETGVWWKIAGDLIHSIAVAVWTGGLLSLFLWLSELLRSGKVNTGESFTVVQRFSHFAMASTAIIGGTGLLMAYTLGVSLFRPWETDYGLLLIGKVVIFTLALCAAAINQFVHIRKMRAHEELGFIKAIRREVRLELVFVIGVFVLAGFLTRTALPQVMP